MFILRFFMFKMRYLSVFRHKITDFKHFRGKSGKFLAICIHYFRKISYLCN